MKKLTGYRRYPDGQTVYDEDVYQFIYKHSRLIDRLNPRKMVEMTEWAHAELGGSVDTANRESNWKYYGRSQRK